MSVTIDDIIADDLILDITNKMYHYCDYFDGSGYECLYCHEEPVGRCLDIVHKPDCDGKRFLAALTKVTTK